MRHTNTYRGCKLLMPALDANAPVMNGRTADPAWPKPAIQPIEPVSSHRGRMRLAWFMAMGYMGPRKTPTMETATAPPIREGVNQTISSSLVQSQKVGKIAKGNEFDIELPYG